MILSLHLGFSVFWEIKPLFSRPKSWFSYQQKKYLCFIQLTILFVERFIYASDFRGRFCTKPSSMSRMGIFSGNTKGGSIIVPLTSCLTGLDKSVLKKIVSCHTADSKPVKQEVNGTVILPPLVFPVFFLLHECISLMRNRIHL